MNEGSTESEVARSEGRRVFVRPGRSLHLIVGGALTTLAGALSVFNGLSGIFAFGVLGIGPEGTLTQEGACGFIMLLFGAVALAGGICALRGRCFTLALAGAALGTMGGGFVGFIAGMSALVIFFFSNEDI